MEQLENVIKESYKKTIEMLKESEIVKKKIKEHVQVKIKDSILRIKSKHFTELLDYLYKMSNYSKI